MISKTHSTHANQIQPCAW